MFLADCSALSKCSSCWQRAGRLSGCFGSRKEEGLVDRWRSYDPWRILCEVYAKLCAMVIQQWLIHLGCWHDPMHSAVKAAQVCRREAGRIMVGLQQGQVETALTSQLASMHAGSRLHPPKRLPPPAPIPACPPP